MAKVSLQGITQEFGSVTAIRDITFNVSDRAFWVLVGPSGCGKSTILRTIAGLEAISQGKLYIGERLVNNIPARQRDVAMVFQNYALYPHMSVADNLAFGLRMRGETNTEIANKVREVSRALDIEHLLKRKPKQLSGGQQQRVALGRAIVRQPQVFLLDEPLSNLDPQLRDGTRAELKQLHDRLGITTIYVTHDRVEAMTLADCLVVLQDGTIQQIGTPHEIYHHPANRMVASLMGSPPMNILPATYLDGNWIIESHYFPVSEAIEKRIQPHHGQGFDLGIRPEHIQIKDLAATDTNSFLPLTIDIIEPLGKETVIRGHVPDSSLTIEAVVAGNWQGTKGDRVAVEFAESNLFIFDRTSGMSINGITLAS
jgi:multiple sugar transport system ATP-binding protein